MKRLLSVFLIMILLGVALALPAFGAAVSENDSTQPRGAPTGLFNDQDQLLDPIIDGFRAPARFDREFPGEYDSRDPYQRKRFVRQAILSS
jgi:hypothetical protein